jgi:hypothetical protein
MTLENARLQWAEGLRRLDRESGEPARGRHLGLLVDAVNDELRRRIGQTFTLAELASAYDRAEDWVREVVVDSAPPAARAGVRDTVLVQDAAFGLYARGASDYSP